MSLDGPISIDAPGVHYNVSADDYAKAEATLAPYRVNPATLQRVFAGDSPEAPEWTVALRFPDQETADRVLGSLA